jgi:SAM-dependent methyltransferase
LTRGFCCENFKWCPSINGYFVRFLRQAQILILKLLPLFPAVKIFAFLELEQNISFPDGHRVEAETLVGMDGIMKISIEDLLPLLRCPKTHASLDYQQGALVTGEGLRYPVQDGIIDLVDRGHEGCDPKMEAGYDDVGGLKYDLWIKNPLIMGFIWGLGVLKAPVLIRGFLEIPAGWILDIPCGTGVFSISIYKAFPDARFVAADYSTGMLRAAMERMRKNKIDNVIFVRADVANLPFADGMFAGAVSLAGFHAFPDPAAAGVEIGRALQPGAPLLMTVACSGVRKISDMMINRYMLPRGYFSHGLPPERYREFLEMGQIRDLQVRMAGAIAVAKGRRAS